MAESDTQLDLKKRARRRLVGAVVLAVAAAVVLPMVMESEPRPANQEIQVRIPGKDEVGFVGRIGSEKGVEAPASPSAGTPVQPAEEPSPPGSPREAAPAAGAEAAAPAADKFEGKPGEKAAVPLAKAAEKTSEHASAKVDGATESAQASKATTKPAEKPAEKVVKKAEEQTADAARARAILEGVGAQSSGATRAERAGGGQFVLQFGVFADPDNARKVQERVRGQGYNAYVEPVQTGQGTRHRVRAGPFGSRESAEQARAKLKEGLLVPGS
ncbi:MAG: SPOR domain-containing protein [Betaproteobacteria bacterium]|nr:SPOR domain-containing protein [Betaproteobacteria bacterium]